MIRLLRLFSAYVELETKLRVAEAELERERRTAEYATKSFQNLLAMIAGLPTVHEDAYHIERPKPSAEEMRPVESKSFDGRARVREINQKNIDDYLKRHQGSTRQSA